MYNSHQKQLHANGFIKINILAKFFPRLADSINRELITLGNN
ncbi:Putative uncharacterized protein [Moritella viscosa]|nr:Putative uncharacterized protein [Moritella viscosa]